MGNKTASVLKIMLFVVVSISLFFVAKAILEGVENSISMVI